MRIIPVFMLCMALAACRKDVEIEPATPTGVWCPCCTTSPGTITVGDTQDLHIWDTDVVFIAQSMPELITLDLDQDTLDDITWYAKVNEPPSAMATPFSYVYTTDSSALFRYPPDGETSCSITDQFSYSDVIGDYDSPPDRYLFFKKQYECGETKLGWIRFSCSFAVQIEIEIKQIAIQV